MKKRKKIRGFYAIIDSTYVKAPEMGRIAAALVSGGAKIVQLRAKELGAQAQLKAARAIRKATLRRAVFIVNDRVDIALLSGADGVHLGQDDLPVEEARRLLGARAVIGLSTHNVKEVKDAAKTSADYISFGPVYQTVTKKDAQKPKGVANLKKACKAAKLQVVAIGGINEANAASVISAGASAAAIISDVLLSRDVRAKAASIVKVLDGAGKTE